MEIDRGLRLEAAHHLSGIPNVRGALLEFGKNPEVFSDRVTEFGQTLGTMNTLLRGSDLDANTFGKLVELRSCLPVLRFPALGEAGVGSIQDTFLTLRQKITSGEWEFPTQIMDNPNHLASGLLIKGYGLFLERIYKQEDLARKFVLAFKEFIYNTHPESLIVGDVVKGMRAEADEFSPGTADRLWRYFEVASYLNSQFQKGISASNLLSDIQKMPWPIVVDFNNVIANNRTPWRMNPEAPDFLRDLRKLGNVFIVTATTSWDAVHNFLEKNGLWTPDIVVMTAINYSPASDPNPYKRIAHFFDKFGAVPIIDNDPEITKDNPGMLGILVKEWEPEDVWSDWHNQDQGRLSLPKAVEVVGDHFYKLF